MANEVYVVSEGEQYYSGFLVHAVYTDSNMAVDYARDVADQIGGVRWPDVYVVRFKLNVVGGMPIVGFTEKRNR